MENKSDLLKWDKIKKIIAREGLILIVITILTGVFFYLAHLQATRISPRLDNNGSHRNFDVAGAKKEGDTDQGIRDYLAKGGKSPQEISEIFKDYELSKLPDKELFDLSGTSKSERPLFYRYDFSKLGIYFLIFAYPLYLMVRFILWAITTLKGRG